MSKSPIETKMIAAIMSNRPEWASVAIIKGAHRMAHDPEADVPLSIEEDEDGEYCYDPIVRHGAPASLRSCTLYTDVKALSYRIDIVLVAIGSAPIAIECDGHDFHERTKQQAAYDRSRDRELLAIGLVTLRFTGSEIVHSPERCAADVWTTAKRLWVAEWQRQDDELRRAFEQGKERAAADAVNAIEEHW